MKKCAFAFFAMLLPLAGCENAIDEIAPVDIPFGTRIGMDEQVKGESHMTEISYEKLSSLVADKESFVLMVHSTTNFCSCYTAWHRDVYAPYVKARGMLVYFVDYQNIEGKENYGLSVLPNHETIGIFEKGVLKYQQSNSDQKDEWTTSPSYFAEWMDARVSKPKAFYVNLEQLDALYGGRSEFTVLFTRSSCPDCAYLAHNDLPKYLLTQANPAPLYLLDCDVVGIRYVVDENGKTYGPSNADGASAKQLEAYAQWSSFKQEYGLAYSEDNPAGWNSGYVPTIYHVNPDGSSKRGGVIDGAGVFYNDSRFYDQKGWDVDDKTVASTYFTADRLQLDALQYLRESSVQCKVLDGITIEGDNRHDAFAPYHYAILKALLDWSIGN